MYGGLNYNLFQKYFHNNETLDDFFLILIYQITCILFVSECLSLEHDFKNIDVPISENWSFLFLY